MPRLRMIESPDDPALAPYLTLRRSEEHERAGIFVAEGPKVIERALAASLANAENLGTAVALGAQAVLCGETNSLPWLRRAVHTCATGGPPLPAADLSRDVRIVLGSKGEGFLARQSPPLAPTRHDTDARRLRPAQHRGSPSHRPQTRTGASNSALRGASHGPAYEQNWLGRV